MATKRGRPPKPKPTWRDRLTADEKCELRYYETRIKELAPEVAELRAKRRQLQQRASRRMRDGAKRE